MAITNSPVTGTMKYLTIGENTYELAGSSGSGNGTVTSVGVSNATNGGLSVSGSPITTSGSITIGHSNVLSAAQTTQAVYPIKIDKNGHISEYGNAVSIPTKVSDLTNDSGFVTTDTKNTAGSTNSNSKLFLIGATEQNANPQTYSNSKLYYNTGLHSEAESNYYDNLSTISQTSNSIKFDVFDESYDNIVLTMKNGAITLAGVDPSSSGFDPTNDYYLQYDAENNNMTIKGVVTPTADRDAANKAYVDSLPGLSSWAKASTKPSYTASQVGAAASDHIHGNLTNGGDITATAPTIASGDQIIINDNSASKITNGPTFDGSTTTKALTPKGTWETFLQTDENVKVTAISSGTNYYPTFIDTSNTTTGTLKSNSCFKYSIDSSASYIDLGNTSLKGKIRLSNTTSGNTVIHTKIQPSGTANRTITLPDASGTVALTSNIPTVPTNISSFTNDSGYTTNTGTVTSVGLSNATNGGLTISGSPITGSGSITVGHSNVLSSAQTTQALYPIKIDKNGHISAYGTAVTSLPASDVSSWAKASSKPSYTASEVGAVSTSNITESGEAGKIPKIKSDGVLELRKYVDLHDTSSSYDNDVRITCTSGSANGQGTINIGCGALKINSNTVEDFVISQGSSSPSWGDGKWRWREWKSGKVEIWYGKGSATLTTTSTSGGVNRGALRVDFPNSYSLYNCTCIIGGMTESAWLGCGGLFNSSDVATEPFTKAQIMAYKISGNTLKTAQTNVNIYICGQKTAL